MVWAALAWALYVSYTAAKAGGSDVRDLLNYLLFFFIVYNSK